VEETADLTLLATTQIVTAWLGSHEIATSALPELIRSVHGSLRGIEPEPDATARKAGAKGPLASERTLKTAGAPAVEIRRSVFADHIVCLEEGKSVTMLKRHLMTAHHLTPEEYRTKWKLPASYPMVAPNYAKLRSRLAKEGGLGKRH
jgi:predicted transcriptional regulator